MTEDGDIRRKGKRDDGADLQSAPNANMWGFAIEVLHLLYRMGPAVVVVAGFLALILFIIYITFYDVMRLFTGWF